MLHNFGGSDGDQPVGGVVLDSQGNLYGTTQYGGTSYCSGGEGCGTIYKLDTSGNLTTLHGFSGSPDGQGPQSGLLLIGGKLYGTAAGGGANGTGVQAVGTVFEVNASTGATTVLHTFGKSLSTGAAPGGAEPIASLISDGAGNLYGTTWSGGDNSITASGLGVVFKLNLATGRETVLHTFTGLDGANPSAGLVRDSAGNLHGITELGGPSFTPTNQGLGVVFELDSAGNFTILYSFAGGTDGFYPIAGLALDSQGNLYGATQFGGFTQFGTGGGTIFEITP